MMSWRKSRAVSEVCLSSGKLPRMPRSSSPPKGGLVMMISTRSRSPISRSGKRRLFSGSIFGDSRPCKSRFICASRYGSDLASPPKMLCVLKNLSVLDRLALLLQVLVRLDQKSAGAAGRIEDHFAESGVR